MNRERSDAAASGSRLGAVDEQYAAIGRLLRWYPKRWRREHGAALLGVLLDQAEAEGRLAPTARERGSAMVNGIAVRLDATAALWLAASALVLNAVSTALMLFFGGIQGVPVSGSAAVNAIAPGLTVIAAVALMRARGWVSGGRALAALAALLPALAVGALARASWSVGFQLANDDLAIAGFAAAWPVFALVGWGLGTLGIGLIVEEFLMRLRPAAARFAVALLAGAVTSITLGAGLAVSGASSSTIVAIAVAILALRDLGGRGDDPRTAASAMPRTVVTAQVPGRATSAAWLSRSLCGLSAVGGAFGIAVALTGAQWLPGTADGTVAMGRGITILLASALPLLAVLGRGSEPGPVPARRSGPLALIAIALILFAISYLFAPAWDDMRLGVAGASLFFGAAAAWWASGWLPGPLLLRIVVAGAVGTALMATALVMVVPMLAFAVPVLAVVLALRQRARVVV